MFLYLIIKKYAGEKAALWSVFIYAVLPLNILFQNQVQPEPLMLMSIVAGLYFFDRWIDGERIILLIASAVFVSVACLIKPTSFHIGIPIMYLCWKKYRSRMFIKPALILYAVFTIAVVALWYYYAHRIKFQTGLTFGIWEYGDDKWGNWKMLTTWKFWNTIVFNLLAGRHLTWTGFLILVFGIYSWKKNSARIFDVWLISTFIYMLIAARGNYVHAYYQFPFILPAVYYMGTVCARYCIPGNLRNTPSLVFHILLFGMVVLSGVIYAQALNKQDTSTDKMFLLAEDIKRTIPAEMPIVIVDQKDPVVFYNSHTKGWHLVVDNFDSLHISMAAKKGARYLALIHSNFNDMPEESYKNSLVANNQTIVNNTNSLIVSLERFK
jgi:4-amino-4-deoxy-L-arabinose transferase-like glycosyltransferase